MKTWHIVLIVVSCMLTILAVAGITILMIDRSKTGPTKEEVVVSQVHNKYPESTNWPEGTIVKIARETCADLDRGDSMQVTIMNIATRYPAGAESDYDMIAFTMVTGIKELCPQHVDKAREFANGG